MPRGKLLNGLVTQQKVLRGAVTLFLEKGYTKTTTGEIAKAAGIGQSSFFHVFPSKEALLLELVQRMFSGQFALAGQHSGEQDPVLLYAVETALQLHIAELTEPLRELYVMAYSLPSIAAYLYKSTTKRLQVIFGPYLPEAQPKDFYEMEIASGSIMRGFMSVPCDVYFTMDAKVSRFLDCSLKLYDVPKEKRAAITAAVLQLDLHAMAASIIQKTVQQAEKGFEALTENKFRQGDIPLVPPKEEPNDFHHGGITMNKRFFSLLAAFALCLTLIPTTAFADDEKRGEDVSPCSCETACTTDNMNKECPVCGAENAIPQNCGQYIPVEDRTGENGSTERADDPNGPTELSAADQVQAMIDGLPNAEEITEDNAEEVKAQLEAIDEAKEKLSDEEIDELDMTRYAEAAAALGGAGCANAIG